MVKHIDFDSPNVSELEKKYLCKCIDSGFVSSFGPFTSRLEEKFAKYINVRKAVSVQSCTAAIHISLHELGVGKGDEVIAPALTFVATVNPILYMGANPVFVDVDAETWNIIPEEVKKAVTKKTKAIIPVHIYGNPCDMDEIIKIAREHKLYVIEDAAQSLGAKYKGKYVGTMGDLGCFSFNGNKVITTGGGGMVAGNNAKRLNHIKYLVSQARDDIEGYSHSEVGFNYRMTNIEASLGLAQMEKLGKFLSIKNRFNRIYKDELKNYGFIHFQEEYSEAESSHWLTCIVFEKEIDISSLQKKLKEKGVPTRKVYMPLTAFAPYRRYKIHNLTNSYRIYERGLCLPGSTLNSEDDIYYICKTLKGLVKKI